MFEPLVEMEDVHEVNLFTMSGPLVGPVGQNEDARSSHDLMNRRLKNRERQRRYRARKRLEADKKKATTFTQSIPPQGQLLQLPEGPSNSCVTRVHRQRNWKKDARKAHLYSNGSITSNTPSACGSQMVYLQSEVQESSVLDNGEIHRTTPNRRNWKAEARNKKN